MQEYDLYINPQKASVGLYVHKGAGLPDLADPEKRTREDIAHALELISAFQKYFDVILGLNEKEGYEIGANLGLFSLLARETGFETLLFEPEPVHYSFLNRNVSVFCKTVDCALSNSCGTTNFYVSGEENSGSSSLVMPEGGWSKSEYKNVVPVRVSTFDAILSELNLNPSSIQLIKIDVEGNEEQTVRGMKNYLRSSHAAPIWCEVRGPSSGRGRNSAVSVSSFLAKCDVVCSNCHRERTHNCAKNVPNTF